MNDTKIEKPYCTTFWDTFASVSCTIVRYQKGGTRLNAECWLVYRLLYLVHPTRRMTTQQLQFLIRSLNTKVFLWQTTNKQVHNMLYVLHCLYVHTTYFRKSDKSKFKIANLKMQYVNGSYRFHLHTRITQIDTFHRTPKVASIATFWHTPCLLSCGQTRVWACNTVGWCCEKW